MNLDHNARNSDDDIRAPADLEGDVAEAVSVTQAFVLHNPGGADGSSREGVRIGRDGVDARSAAADTTPEGGVTDMVAHRAAKKEHGELRTANVLVDRLNGPGRPRWQPPEHRTGLEDGVDCIAKSVEGSATLFIQVTTPEREAWAKAKEGPVERAGDVNTVVEAIRVAIEEKHKRHFAGRERIVLALDAVDSPRYALRAVVDAFRKRHGDWVAAVGYAETWIVGPSAEMVYRLDDPPVPRSSTSSAKHSDGGRG